MTRPLRIEFAGALYHVTSRGDGQDNIYLDDVNRVVFLSVILLNAPKLKQIVYSW